MFTYKSELKTLEVSGVSRTLGSVTTTMTVEGDFDFAVRLNGRYVLDALAGWKGFDTVTIHLNAEQPMRKATVIGDWSTRVALVMPMTAER